MGEIQVEVWRLVQDEAGNHVVVLRDQQQRHLPIWIGPYEATAIWARLSVRRANALLRRPMTHDLCATIIERLGTRIERVVVDDYSNQTYYAKIHLAVDGRRLAVDSRPSDAIALALRCEAPVWVSEQIVEEHEIVISEGEPPADDASDDEPLAPEDSP